MELVKFSSWPEVMAYAKAGRPLYYQAPMDQRATRFLPGSKQTFAYSAQGRTIRLWPGGSVGRGRSRTHDPFNADSKHLDRFSHPAEQRVESSGAMREGHRVMSTELARRYPLGWTMAKHLMDWSYRRKGAIETISASKIRKQGYNVEQVRAALKDNETFENFDGNVYSGSDGSGGMWRVEITDENEKSTVARERHEITGPGTDNLYQYRGATIELSSLGTRKGPRYSAHQSEDNALIDFVFRDEEKIGYIAGPFSNSKGTVYRWELYSIPSQKSLPFGMSGMSGEARSRQAALNALTRADKALTTRRTEHFPETVSEAPRRSAHRSPGRTRRR